MLVDEALRTRFGLPLGIANAEVTVADPAMGTGTFLLETMRTVGTKIEADLGVGAVGESVKDYLTRLIGFELQVGPFAVAQLRLLAELTAIGVGTVPPDALRLYLTNTLGNPYLEEETLGSWYEPISESRRQGKYDQEGRAHPRCDWKSALQREIARRRCLDRIRKSRKQRGRSPYGLHPTARLGRWRARQASL
jgi:hypothetical protein